MWGTKRGLFRFKFSIRLNAIRCVLHTFDWYIIFIHTFDWHFFLAPPYFSMGSLHPPYSSWLVLTYPTLHAIDTELLGYYVKYHVHTYAWWIWCLCKWPLEIHPPQDRFWIILSKHTGYIADTFCLITDSFHKLPVYWYNCSYITTIQGVPLQWIATWCCLIFILLNI